MDFKEGNSADKAQVLSFIVNLKCSFSLCVYVVEFCLFLVFFIFYRVGIAHWWTTATLCIRDDSIMSSCVRCSFVCFGFLVLFFLRQSLTM